jgi:hypothetical protein
VPVIARKNSQGELHAASVILWFIPLVLSLSSGTATAWSQACNWKPVVINGGGYVDGIVFHPNAPGLIYCRTDIGGAYRGNPANNTWIPLLDFIGYPNNEWSLLSIESVGLDALDSNPLYLTCGCLGNPGQIVISTNQGASFTRINSPFVIRSNDDGRGIGERFGVARNLGSTIFYGTRQDDLWKSVNQGANWAKVASFPVSTAGNGVGLAFMEFIQSSGSGYAAIATNASLAFTKSGLNNGTRYYFVASAVNGSGEGGNSSEVSAHPTSSAPTQFGFIMAGNQLHLYWPADHTGWDLQSQSNNLAVGPGTNWGMVPDSAETNQANVTVAPITAAVFFRLVRPWHEGCISFHHCRYVRFPSITRATARPASVCALVESPSCILPNL